MTRMKRTGWWLLASLLVPVPSAAQTSQAIEYYGLDALGSVRVVLDPLGTVVRRHDFRPFGEEWQAPIPPGETRLFTGQERDVQTGFDYFGARYYRANLGRFTTIDAALGRDPETDSQRWNAYVYTSDNPLTRIDPRGLRWFTRAGIAVWVDPNPNGTYTSPGEGWVELDPKNYNYGMNVAFVNGTLSYIGEDPEGRKMLAPWMPPEQGLEDTTFFFLAPFQISGVLATRALGAVAANRLPSIGFKILNPTRVVAAGVDYGVAQEAVRLAIVKQVILKQVQAGVVTRGTVLLEGRVLAYTAWRQASGEIVVTSLQVLK